MTRLADIIGHEAPLAILGRAMAEERLHHALLFCGPPAVGKRTLALALAAALNCSSPRPLPGGAEDACGDCPACRKAAEQRHPDISFVTLEKTVIPIEAVRKLRKEAAFAPFEGRRRVFIVDPADRLSIEAQNALLKTLEEPAGRTCIIMVTSRPMWLLATTRSRCQAIQFGSMAPAAATQALIARTGMEPAAARRAARLASGRIGAALNLDLEDRDARILRLLDVLDRLCSDIPRLHVLADAELFGEEPAEVAQHLEDLALLLRDLQVMCAGASAELLIHGGHDESVSRLSALAPRCAGRVHDMTQRVRAAQSDLEANVNRRVLIETMLFDLGACPSNGLGRVASAAAPYARSRDEGDRCGR